ncbi:MAG TPA: xanthine dehydrogenase family protein subunit M [Anaerolineales bacterium]|nr:xanthine dehydrogenase family protein subunit M [Anaerolineales bacterium]
MKPASFDYAAPNSLEAALALKAQHGDDAKFLAGGQSLIPAMNFRLVQTSLLVDVNNIRELDYVHESNGELHIGAMTRQRRLERDPLVKARAPLLHEAIPWVAHLQIRNRGTIGGSIAHADPAAELPVVVVALGARLKIQSNRDSRWVAAADFFKGLFTVDLAADEMLTEIVLPALPLRTGTAFVEFARRRGDYALMGVAAVVTLDEKGMCQDGRLVFLNAGEGPLNAKQASGMLRGQMLSPKLIDESATLAAQNEIQPMGNVHASAEYQRHLAKVLAKRALKTALERAH